MRKIAIFGRNGQLARELADLAWPRRIRPCFLGRGEVDILSVADVTRQIRALDPVAVINTAAYTAVDRAEAEPFLAQQLNAEAPAVIAGVVETLGIPLVHISTDYVFSGAAGRPYREDDETAPLSVYGQTKMAGERAVAASGARAVTVRSASLFGRHGQNFLKAILAKAAVPGTEIHMVADQVCSPTPAADLARLIAAVALDLTAGRRLPACLHVAGGPAVSWFDFTGAILDVGQDLGMHLRPALTPAKLADLSRPAPRPLNSALDCRFAASLGYLAPDWRAALPGLVNALRNRREAA
ncbi:dTDP-4-dehydrorhamnose reductase [Dongia sp.]|uniref:dTDP-4-dehydrorhamnose reductase n=1 Tax=Dongia sp. TaxID=1977262 RepID=UPI0035AF4708